MEAGGVQPGPAPPVRAEIVHSSERTRITRLFLPGRTVIRKEPLGPDAERRVRHEAAMLARLPGVAGVAQLARAPRYPGPVMLEDAGAASLAGLAKPLPVGKLTGLGLRLAKAVAGMHERGVIHRECCTSTSRSLVMISSWPGTIFTKRPHTWRVIRNSPAQAFADLHLGVGASPADRDGQPNRADPGGRRRARTAGRGRERRPDRLCGGDLRAVPGAAQRRRGRRDLLSRGDRTIKPHPLGPELARAHLLYGNGCAARAAGPTPARSYAPPTRCSPRTAWRRSPGGPAGTALARSSPWPRRPYRSTR
jgi:hypothetical protein